MCAVRHLCTGREAVSHPRRLVLRLVACSWPECTYSTAQKFHLVRSSRSLLLCHAHDVRRARAFFIHCHCFSAATMATPACCALFTFYYDSFIYNRPVPPPQRMAHFNFYLHAAGGAHAHAHGREAILLQGGRLYVQLCAQLAPHASPCARACRQGEVTPRCGYCTVLYCTPGHPCTSTPLPLVPAALPPACPPGRSAAGAARALVLIPSSVGSRREIVRTVWPLRIKMKISCFKSIVSILQKVFHDFCFQALPAAACSSRALSTPRSCRPRLRPPPPPPAAALPSLAPRASPRT